MGLFTCSKRNPISLTLEESLEIELFSMWNAIIRSDELPDDLDSSDRTSHSHFRDQKITLNLLSHTLTKIWAD